MNSNLLIPILILSFFLSGCIVPTESFCGDGVCVQGVEDNSDLSTYCFADCGEQSLISSSTVTISAIDDESRHYISGVSISLSGSDGVLVNGITGENGTVVFDDVPVGTYTVTLEHIAFKTLIVKEEINALYFGRGYELT